ncbi:phosphatase PAP2 family protein [Spirillospora sp. CA-294931]|uniref:phosphatase PAP2 family protein n=1 Tax=Spirillospora sp. CA-294931 TaxID=3240042 RepID=UPI003D931615
MLTDFMHVVSFVGSGAFYLPVIVLVFWCVSPRFGARAAVVMSFGSVVNTVLKLAFHSPRPFWTDASITGHEGRDSFGMPSGHAQSASLAWGFLAVHLRRWTVWAAAAVMVVLIGVSRVQLGVHSVGQVVAGWAVGAVLLVAALGLEPLVVPWWRARALAVQLALCLAVSGAFLLAAWAAVESLEGWEWPAAWSQAIVEAGGTTGPITLSRGATAAGGLCGILAGVTVLAHRGGFEAEGVLWRRLARVPVGVTGLLAIYACGLPFGDQPVQAFAVQALLGLWTAAGAPEAFVRLGLARRTPRAVTRAGEGVAELRQ